MVVALQMLGMKADIIYTHQTEKISIHYKSSNKMGCASSSTMDNNEANSNTMSMNEQPLLDALWKKNYDAAECVLPLMTNLNYTDQKGMTALQICAARGEVDFMQKLIAKGSPVDGTLHGQWTALQLAAFGGHCEAIQMLVKNSATLDQVYPWTSPLHIATCQGNASAVKLLLELGADILAIDQNGANVLHSAVQACCCRTKSDDCIHVDTLMEVLSFANKKGIAIKDLEKATKHQSPILTCCLDVDNLNLLQMLINSGADLEDTDTFGETVLHRATWLGNSVAVECLLLNGAYPGAKDNFGYTPLHNAVVRNFPDIVRSLLRRSVDVNALTYSLKNAKEYKKGKIPVKVKQPFSAIQLAIFHGNAVMAKILISMGADCRITTQHEKMGVLQLAHKMWPSYTLEVLDRYLAPVAGDIHVPITYGYTKKPKRMINIAIQNQDPFLAQAVSMNPLVNPTETLKMLFDVKVGFWDIYQMCDTVNTLITRGACPNIPVGKGRSTPLIWAIQNGDFETTKLLLKAGAHVDRKLQYDHYGCSIACALDAALHPFDRRFMVKKLPLVLAADCDLHVYWNNPRFVTVTDGEKELLEKKKSTVLSLKQIARKCVRNHLCHAKQIDQLPLPKVLKSYLYIPELDDIMLTDHERLQEIRG